MTLSCRLNDLVQIWTPSGVTDVADTEWHKCQYCHRRPVSGLWFVAYTTGKRTIMEMCATCGLSDFPQRTTVEKIVLLKSLSRDPNAVAAECTHGLVATGTARSLKSLAKESEGKLLGVYFEMKCPKCGYITEVPMGRVTAATRSYTHPNNHYEHKKP
jgi:phage FluMu protein Com